LERKDRTYLPFSHIPLFLVAQPCFPELETQIRHTSNHRLELMSKVARASWGSRNKDSKTKGKKLS
jgi:hypothetical protein